MYFLHPEILWWLFLVLIPVIIHMFNFRRYKKFYFSDIQFLKNVTRQTQKQNKLKHLVVLMLRMLALAFIVTAFASPRLGKHKKEINSKVKSIYIDNSFSMAGESNKGIVFEMARNMAGELVKSSEMDIRFLIQTNDYSSGRKPLSREEAIKEINKIKISPSIREFSGVNSVQQKVLKNIKGYESYWFSDYQKYAVDVYNFNTDTVNDYIFMPINRVRNKNIYVDTCYFNKPVVLPSHKALLTVVVKNVSGAEYEKVPLKLFINDKLIAVEGVDLKPFKNKTVEFTFVPEKKGWQYGKVSVEDYPVTFDDELYFTFNIKGRINVLDIYLTGVNKYIESFYSADSNFNFTAQNYLKIDLSSLEKFDLIILDGLKDLTTGLTSVLKNYINQGGNVLLIPSSQLNVPSLNEFLRNMNAGSFNGIDTVKSRVVAIKKDSRFFKETVSEVPKNASLPTVHTHFPYWYSIKSGVRSLMTILNGDDLLAMKKEGRGSLFVLTTPLNMVSTDFMFNPLFVSVLYGVSVALENRSNLFYFIGEDVKVDIPVIVETKDEIFTLKQKNGDFSFIPGQQNAGSKTFLTNLDRISKAGFYEGTFNDSTYFVLAFNYNHKESEMDFLSVSQIDSLLKRSNIKNYIVEQGEINNIRKVINQEQKGSKLWKLFIILALLMLLAESLILRRWK